MKRNLIVLISAFVILSVQASICADIRLPAIINDHMVLQQNQPVNMWGWADPGETVTVSFSGHLSKSAAAVTASDGKWKMKLTVPEAGGPYTLVFEGNNRIEINDVMVGEVWVCSGQSNMEFGIKGVNNAEEEIKSAEKYSMIRQFRPPRHAAAEPQEDCKGQWLICDSENVQHYSAVAFFFARELTDELNVPIGLIHSSWGGTPAQAWTRKEVIDQFPYYVEQKKKIEQSKINPDRFETELEKKIEQWNTQAASMDTGMEENWYDPKLNDSNWKTMSIPVRWEKVIGQFDGIVWFRKKIDIPESLSGKDLYLHLGPVDDMDITWVNGERVGSMQVYGNWKKYRRYQVPASILKEKDNVIVVRVLDVSGGGGMHGNAKLMKLTDRFQSESVPLAGDWLYRKSCSTRHLPRYPRPFKIQDQHVPSALYNGMIAPVIPYTIRGAIWYQGESNASKAHQYRKLFPAMIENWRVDWGQGNFPFYFVQLANFTKVLPEPADSDWAELREAQLMTLGLENTGMAVTIDIGDANDIHPRNKQDVGKRLSLWALAKDYGRDIVYSGPLYKMMEIDGSNVIIHFDHAGSGLTAKGGSLKGFAIAGPDRKFVWADAEIKGDTVVVSSSEVAKPVAVRYAWAKNPVCNLYNQEGLPASPFRTDNFPCITKIIKD